MSIMEFLRISLFKPNELANIIERPLKSSKLVLSLLAILLMLPGAIQVSRVFSHLEQDVVQIDDKLPNFTITNGTLTTQGSSKGFIYRSDSLSFVFDPSGKTSEGDLMNETSNGTPAFAFLQDGFYLESPINSQKVSYSQMNGFDKASFTQAAQAISSSHWIAMIAFNLMYFVFNYVYLLIVLWIISGLVRLLTLLFMRMIVQFPRKVGWQLTVSASVLPIVIYAVLDLVGFTIVGPGEFLFFATSINWILNMRTILNQQKK